jgi:MFS superfamily sulfate permease-like transporter
VDFLVGILTATITFFISVPVGLASGTGISLLFILYRISKPHWAILGEMVIRTGDHTSERVWRNIKRYQDTTEYPGILVWRFDSSLYFVNVRYWRDVLMKVCAERINGKDLDVCPNSIDHVILHEQPSPTTITMPKHIPVQFVILDFSPVNDIDISGANTILHSVENIERKFHVKVLFSGVKGNESNSFLIFLL